MGKNIKLKVKVEEHYTPTGRFISADHEFIGAVSDRWRYSRSVVEKVICNILEIDHGSANFEYDLKSEEDRVGSNRFLVGRLVSVKVEVNGKLISTLDKNQLEKLLEDNLSPDLADGEVVNWNV